MKESKFIELLNLYVDHQISPTDAALLEAEIQKRPERRKIYREYCQMQKGCSMLAESFRTDSPAVGTLGEMTAEPRRFAFVTYAMGFAAAAACIALVVVKRPSPVQAGIGAEYAATVTSASVAGPEASMQSARPALQEAFPGVMSEAATIARNDRTGLEWMSEVQFERVVADELRFDVQPTLQTQDLTLRTAQPYEGRVETTAFIFAKE